MNKRQEEILIATITDYVGNATPVSSTTLKENHHFSCSSATIRNDCKALAESGYLAQNHSSSGRIPTTKAYRHYVNYLKENGLDHPQLVTFMKDITTIEHSITELMTALSQSLVTMTPYAMVLFLPDTIKTVLKATYLLSVDLSKVLIVLLGSLGMRKEHLCTLSQNLSQDELNQLSKLISEKIEGVSATDITDDFIAKVTTYMPKYQSVLTEILSQIKSCSTKEQSQGSIQTFGQSKLLQFPEFSTIGGVKQVLGTLEETQLLCKLFNAFMETKQNYDVVIGEEGGRHFSDDCSMVLSGCHHEDIPVAGFGFIGPNRMSYSETISFAQGVCKEITTLNCIK